MIRFDNVTVRQNGHTILDGVSFEIGSGEKAAFFGKSASGKTTILKTLVGAYVPVGGAVFFNGGKLTAGTIAAVRQSVSYIAQEPALGAENVREAVLLPFTYQANRSALPDDAIVNRYLEQLHLAPSILAKPVSVLSGGEKQRIAIARALLQRKQVFVLDEVTSSLDPESKAAVHGLFQGSAYTIASVSHDREWFAVCNRFFEVERGKLKEVLSAENNVKRKR